MEPSKPTRLIRRIAPTLIGVTAVVSGFVALQAGLTPTAEVAAPIDRTSDQTANRSAARSGELDTSSDSVVIAAVAPSTTVPETTTTVAPTTTSTEAPTTTTTAAPVTTTTETPVAVAAAPANTQSGQASYYDYKAGGCAHKTIPKGTTVTVTNTATGQSATCVVNDRGPFVAGRIIDLDVTVFKQLASTSAGVFTAKITW